VDPRHSDMLERFAALRLEAMGGVLATWTSNLNECLRRAEAERDDGRRRFERRLAAAPAFYDIENVVQAAPTDVDKQLELLRDMPLTDAAKSGLIPDIMAGAVELVSVWVYDTDSEDGDVVRIETDKSAYEVRLSNAKTQVTLPVVDGKVRMVGVADGNGGITVGIETMDGRKSLTPVMRVGESIAVPFFIE
ncbi:MAG: hypothetical protein AAFU70_12575, partial [Planctomycetota bacterium]